MAKSKILEANKKIEEKVVGTFEKIEDTVVGGYTKQEKTMVRIVFSRREYIKVKDFIAEIDPNAFVTYTQSQFVHGEGFKKSESSKTNSLTEVKKLINKIKNRKEKDGK